MIIDGKAESLKIKDEVRARVEELRATGRRIPCLAVIIVGNNPASRSYVNGKIKAAAYTGIESREYELQESTSEDELLSVISELNGDSSVDGILVQLPLPWHISEARVLEAILPQKDVDGFHPQNVARLWLGQDCLAPCTPLGVIKLIESTGVSIEAKHAVVIGRSDIVGKPVAKLLLDHNATVTIAHSRTAGLAALCREADILVVAVGRPGTVTGDMVKPGAVVIDVGINRGADGRLVGDVDYDSAASVAGWITPVPGGVGPMTIAMLLSNTFKAYEMQEKFVD